MVFDCLFYAHNIIKQHKFDTHSRHFIFIGYPFGQNIYKLYDLDDQTIFINRDIFFFENIFLSKITIIMEAMLSYLSHYKKQLNCFLPTIADIPSTIMFMAQTPLDTTNQIQNYTSSLEDNSDLSTTKPIAKNHITRCSSCIHLLLAYLKEYRCYSTLCFPSSNSESASKSSRVSHSSLHLQNLSPTYKQFFAYLVTHHKLTSYHEVKKYDHQREAMDYKV